MQTVSPANLPEMRRTWDDAYLRAESLSSTLPADDYGCLYLNIQGNPVTPDISSLEFKSLIRHRGSIKGAFPSI
ncbi:MAG: hypothetical protein SGI71_12640 [Verrucomicrobiota bacterium]|nr:hypothetical protein [Verrucomicrobiota bacterium]